MAPRWGRDSAWVAAAWQSMVTLADLSVAKAIAGPRDDWRFFLIVTGRNLGDAMSPRIRNLLLTTTALLALGTVPGAAGPDGPVVVGGAATVSGAGTSSVIVNQSSNRAIINWNTFNIGAGETTTFRCSRIPPRSCSTASPAGSDRLDDQRHAQRQRPRLRDQPRRHAVRHERASSTPRASSPPPTTSTTPTSWPGGYNFNIPGRPDASIVNLGRITAASGGFAALVAPGVRNSGTITATLGTVALASGNSFTLDLYGDKLIQLGVNDAIATQVIDVATGQPLKSLVTNEGKLTANGGRVELTAAAGARGGRLGDQQQGRDRGQLGRHARRPIVLGGATGAAKPAGAPKQTVKVSGTHLGVRQDRRAARAAPSWSPARTSSSTAP